jgi:hypothetical protein
LGVCRSSRENYSIFFSIQPVRDRVRFSKVSEAIY